MSVLNLLNYVEEQLLKQNRKSVLDGECVYRHPEGLKCGVGFLISDKDYLPSFEGQIVSSLPETILETIANNFSIKISIKTLIKVLDHIQYVHDRSPPRVEEFREYILEGFLDLKVRYGDL